MPFLSKLRQGKANGWQTIQLGEITDDNSIDCTVNCLRSIPVHECREWTALLLKEINIDRCPKLRRCSLFTLDRVTILYLFQNDFIFFRSSTIRYYIWDCFQYVNVSFLDWKRRIKKKMLKNEGKAAYQDPPRNTEAKLYRFRRSLLL